MQTSLIAFRNAYQDSLLRFLWRQWSRLGVLGAADAEDRWAIDPEALLLLTLEAARLDPRLFDEVMDWLDRNGGWLNVQRLRNLTTADPGFPLPLLSAATNALAARNPARRWRGLQSPKPAADAGVVQSLFVDRDGTPLATVRKPDEAFSRHGYLRPPLRWRGMSQPVPMDPPCLHFKLRALWGVSARADILGYLLLRGEASVSDAAAATHSSVPNVWATLEELAASQQLTVRRKGREKIYGVRQQAWWDFLYPGLSEAQRPAWIEWGRVGRALAAILRWLWRPDLTELRGFALLSELDLLLRQVLFELEASGLPQPPPMVGDVSAERLVSCLSQSLHPLLPALPEKT